MDLFVPQGVDHRIEDWSDNSVEQGKDLGKELGVDGRGCSIQDHQGSVKGGHYSEVGGAGGKSLSPASLSRNPQNSHHDLNI